MLDSTHYGFSRNCSTVNAIHEVVHYISESKRVGQYSTLICLHVKNGFNSARQTDLFRLLAEYSVPSELLGVIDSFLLNRSIILNVNEHYFNVCEPLGSCLGSILLFVLINSLLKRLGVDED